MKKPYEAWDIGAILAENRYPGRGIVVGVTHDGTSAVSAYFIMGRSDNSRNRVFLTRENGDVYTKAFDEGRVKDPSLIIYNAVRACGSRLIVTNGDQTDTVYEHLLAGKTFEDAMDSREFEPDAPNFTPRISALLDLSGTFRYKMSILKSADAEGSACVRETFSYPTIAGVGHFLHTYAGDGDPLPTFSGEPERVEIPNNLSDFTALLWDSLNAENKISLFVRYTDLTSGKAETKLINKNR